MPEVSASDWDAFLANYPDAHLLQTSAWGKLKSAFGWDAVYVLAKDAVGSMPQQVPAPRVGALLLFRRLPLGLTLAYIPKGPVGGAEPRKSLFTSSTLGGSVTRQAIGIETSSAPGGSVTRQLVGNEHSGADFSVWTTLWPEVDQLCRKRKAIFLKVEPDSWEASGGLSSPQPGMMPRLLPPGFKLSQQYIQPPRTLLVDLSGDEAEVLGRMKQKTRYNIHLSMRKGVVICPSSDLDTFYRLMLVTGKRDTFGVHSLEYYRKAYELFQPRGECILLMAEYQGEPIAAIMVFARGRRAWYFYGASSDQHRDRMPTYLLQWEAMRWARARGCSWYDLWGVPDLDEGFLEAHFAERSDGLWGVYRFKRGFGGQLQRAIDPWDRVYKPLLYALYCFLARSQASEGNGR